MTDRKDDDTAAQAARAARIHEQIDALKDKGGPPPRPATPPSPRDFIHRRMKEIDEGEA